MAKEEPINRAIKGLIPELVESEGERIRNWICGIIESLGEPADEDAERELDIMQPLALAWLEKQKEQKPAEKQDYTGLNDLERAIHRGFLSAGVENAPVAIIKETAQECLAQMKPAEWSEEDEKFAYFVNQFLGYYENTDPTAMSCKKWFNNRLKSIRPQLKLEWSKGDEKMLSVISYKISQRQGRDERSLFTPDEAEFIGRLEDKLKSLRPQPHSVSVENAAKFGNLEYERGVKDGIQSEKSHHWKPSEEQMNYLLAVINDPNNIGAEFCYMTIKSLYNDLKKL